MHLLIGFGLPVAARAWLGYEAQGWASVALCAGGSLWEVLTATIGKRMAWTHRYGDVADLGAFCLGVALAAVCA